MLFSQKAYSFCRQAVLLIVIITLITSSVAATTAMMKPSTLMELILAANRFDLKMFVITRRCLLPLNLDHHFHRHYPSVKCSKKEKPKADHQSYCRQIAIMTMVYVESKSLRLVLFFKDAVCIVKELIVMIIIIARSDHFASPLHRGSSEPTRTASSYCCSHWRNLLGFQ